MQEVKTSKRKLADLTNTQPGKKQKPSGKKRSTPRSPEEEMRLIARMATVMSMLWLRDFDGTFVTPLDGAFVDLDRFKTEKTKVQGQVVEILRLIPEKCRNIWATSDVWFQRIVSFHFFPW